MNNILEIKQTEDSPKIFLDENNSLFLIEGSSFPEDAFAVYTPILDWIKKVTSKFNNELKCEFKFKVVSSASHKMLYETLTMLENLYNSGANISIHWHYEELDEDMQEIGEDFSETLSIPFEFFKL